MEYLSPEKYKQTLPLKQVLDFLFLYTKLNQLL